MKDKNVAWSDPGISEPRVGGVKIPFITPLSRAPADLVNLPEEPIKEEEEEEEEDLAGEEDMDSDDRVVEYRDRTGGRAGPAAGGGVRARIGICRGSPTAGSSDSDEMDYDLELKMISTPSPKKSMKMTMYADELETKLKTIR